MKVGSARARARQRGFSFLVVPKTGAVLLRGLVTFEWRLRGEVVKTRRQRTLSGHRSNAGADPPDYSAAVCAITA